MIQIDLKNSILEQDIMEQAEAKKLAKSYKVFLEKNNYSKQTIFQYVKYLSIFLKCEGANIINADNDFLKELIEEYANKLSMNTHKQVTISALHTFYYYRCGELFSKRLVSKLNIKKLKTNCQNLITIWRTH
jgi:site-specific recombinase XerD